MLLPEDHLPVRLTRPAPGKLTEKTPRSITGGAASVTTSQDDLPVGESSMRNHRTAGVVLTAGGYSQYAIRNRVRTAD
jgi:hypothetical protein